MVRQKLRDTWHALMYSLFNSNFVCLFTLIAQSFNYFESHTLPFFQHTRILLTRQLRQREDCIAVLFLHGIGNYLDSPNVDKQVRPGLGGDEAIPFLEVERLDDSAQPL
jgi:hypothetical protein